MDQNTPQPRTGSLVDAQAEHYLRHVLAGILPRPDLLEVRAESGPNDSIHLNIILPPSERGFVIGRMGANYDMIRALMRAYSGLRKRRFIPRILEEGANNERSETPLHTA